MIIEYMTLLYLVLLSLLVIILIDRLSSGVFEGINGVSCVFFRRFLRGYAKQYDREKIFFINFLKYPIFISSSFIILQLQLARLSISSQELILMAPVSIALYIALKAICIGYTGRDSGKYFSFVSALDDFFLDLFLVMIIFALGGDYYGKMHLLIVLFLVGVTFLKISSFNRARMRDNWYQDKGKDEAVLERVTLELGESVYIISLLFFSANEIVLKILQLDRVGIFSIAYHVILVSIILSIVVMIVGMEWILKWLMEKRVLDRQIARVKYVVIPVLLLVITIKAWNIFTSLEG